jgi:hypothetical protein
LGNVALIGSTSTTLGSGEWGPPAQMNDRRGLAIVAFVAVAVRIILNLGYRPLLVPDSASYLTLARRLAAAHLAGGSGTRTPGYPLLLLILGYSARATWCVQAALGVATSLLVYRLIRRLRGSTLVALIGGLLYATSLEVLAVERQVMTETLATFLIVLAASVCVEIIRTETAARTLPLLLGTVLAALCLVRPDALAVTVYLVLALSAVKLVFERRLGRPGATGRTVTRCAAMFLPPIIALAAWATVNRETIGVLSVSTVLGHNMIDQVAPYVKVEKGLDHGITAAYVAARTHLELRTANPSNVSYAAEAAMERASGLDAAHLSGRLLSIALRVIASHPLAYMTASLKQWPRFWLPPNYADRFVGGEGSAMLRAIWKLQRVLQLVVATGFLGLCLLELLRRARRAPDVLSPAGALLAGAVLVGTIPACFLAYGETGRYGYVYYPIVLAVCLTGLVPVGRKLVQPLYHRRSPFRSRGVRTGALDS